MQGSKTSKLVTGTLSKNLSYSSTMDHPSRGGPAAPTHPRNQNWFVCQP